MTKPQKRDVHHRPNGPTSQFYTPNLGAWFLMGKVVGGQFHGINLEMFRTWWFDSDSRLVSGRRLLGKERPGKPAHRWISHVGLPVDTLSDYQFHLTFLRFVIPRSLRPTTHRLCQFVGWKTTFLIVPLQTGDSQGSLGEVVQSAGDHSTGRVRFFSPKTLQ